MGYAARNITTGEVREYRSHLDGLEIRDGEELVEGDSPEACMGPAAIAARQRMATIAAIDADYAAKQETGVTLVGGLRMKSTAKARDDYQQLTTFALLALTTQQAATLSWWDADGTIRQNTPAEWAAIAAEYAQLCAVQRYTYEATRAAA